MIIGASEINTDKSFDRTLYQQNLRQAEANRSSPLILVQ